ncbi:MAG TPA: cytochrome c oxidase accessory protein CcoG [Polyangiaceae bacterium]
MSAPIPAPIRVLPTLNADGTRRLIRPKLYPGRWYKARRAVAVLLLVLFAVLPFLRMNGKPLVLLDVPRREFVLFGHTFLPTDGVLLMLLLLSIFVGIFWITALVGRAWCGWACPQTVYMEFVFRPIERWLEGDGHTRDRSRLPARLRRGLKYALFGVLSVGVGNVFLAYFVGVDALSTWVTRSPLEHPAPFLVMGVTAGLVFLDFAWFREQMCTVICPYARLQSVLLDQRSLIVGYDVRRGEPRSVGKAKPGSGDCIDCNACVKACPTGIDIRQGLQLECIACTQCMDACDSIMHRIEKPPGLIRLASQLTLERGGKARLFRPRVVIYPLVLIALLSALFFTASTRGDAEITVLRGLSAPFVSDAAGVRNQIRIKVKNRSGQAHAYRIELVGLPGAQLIAPENPLRLAAGQQQTTTVFVLAPESAFSRGKRDVGFRISDGVKFSEIAPYKLLGPKSNTGK